jgi:type IV pilus assembly protein PilW
MQRPSQNGFTLVELLVAMAVAGILGAVIATAYQIQVMGKNTQEITTDMNQNARVAMEIMTREIRMAGCNPEGGSTARIIEANPGELIFSFDINDDAGTLQPDGDCCDANEVIRYCLTNDNNNPPDGVNDNIKSGVDCNLGRETGPGNDPGLACPGGGGVSRLQPLARNVDALNFVYLDEDDVAIAAPVAANDLDDIRSIEVTLVARAGRESGGFFFPYTNRNVYENAEGATILPAQNDKFRRLQLTTSINCRNLGRD